MTNSPSSPILVLGGTGKTGRRVVDRLRGLEVPVRVGSRRGTPPFDWQDRSTWASALDGARAAYVSFQPDLAAPGAVETVRAFAELAVARGVRRLVLLSGRGEPEAEEAERAVRGSGADVTVIRSTWFAQNFSEDFMLGQVLDGAVVLPARDVREPFVDADDIADVAVAALTEPGHEGEVYEVTGPALLSFPEAVESIARATGREIAYVPVALEDFVAGARDEGVHPEVVELLAYLFGEVLDGRNAHVTDGVQRALGRPPRSFEAYVRDAAATGVFSPATV